MQRETGARYLRQAPKPGGVCRSKTIVEDSRYDGRRFGALQHHSLTRTVSARSWLEGSSDEASPLAFARVVGPLRQLAVGLDPHRRCPWGDRRRQRFE
jgi:hypothetical protein